MNWIIACGLLAGAPAAPAAAANHDELRQALAALQTDAAASRARAVGIQSVQEARESPAAAPSECDRPGKIKWVQFASDPNRSFLLKVNTDDGSRSVMLYKLLPDGSEACFEVRGPYVNGSAEFSTLEALEKEIREESTVVKEKPWLYLVNRAPNENNLKNRLERD